MYTGGVGALEVIKIAEVLNQSTNIPASGTKRKFGLIGKGNEHENLIRCGKLRAG